MGERPSDNKFWFCWKHYRFFVLIRIALKWPCAEPSTKFISAFPKEMEGLKVVHFEELLKVGDNWKKYERII